MAAETAAPNSPPFAKSYGFRSHPTRTLFDTEFLSKLERLSLQCKRARASGDRGTRQSGRRGASVEFADHRAYNPGDDFRRIDWNLYGRLSRLFIKLYVEEVDLTLHVYVDGSASMSFGAPQKFDTARRVAAAFAYVALAGLDRVKIGVSAGAGWRGFGPARGKGQIFPVLDFLDASAADGPADLARALALQKTPHGGVSVILSDFLCPTSFERALVRMMGMKQRVVLLQVLARDEIDPEIYGDFTLVDSESGDQLDVTAGPRALSAYRQNLARLQGELQAFTKKGQCSYLLVPSDADIVDLMLRAMPRAFILR